MGVNGPHGMQAIMNYGYTKTIKLLVKGGR
jgi:hypothetical protein